MVTSWPPTTPEIGTDTMFKKLTLPLVMFTSLALSACGDANQMDVKGVDGRKPDKIEAYANIDQHPNIVRICIDKVAFLTTSREAGNNLMRVPEWDVSFCGASSSSK